MPKTPIVLLAAGSSQRMGSLKQLLSWGTDSLLDYQVRKLLPLEQEIIVVIGAHAEKMVPVVSKYPVKMAVNPHWDNGMGSSIALGVREIVKNHLDADGAMICVIDQPLIPFAHFENMLRQFKAKKAQLLVSQSLKGYQGVPVLFDSVYFSELVNYESTSGARSLLAKHQPYITFVQGGDYFEDMDTEEDYRRLLQKANLQS